MALLSSGYVYFIYEIFYTFVEYCDRPTDRQSQVQKLRAWTLIKISGILAVSILYQTFVNRPSYSPVNLFCCGHCKLLMIVSTTSHFPRQKQECHSSEDSNLYNRGEKSNQYQTLSQQATQKDYSVGITQCIYLVKIYVLPFQAPKKFAFLTNKKFQTQLLAPIIAIYVAILVGVLIRSQ